MERTYDIFTDNGLFVLSYYINKDIKDITEKDIEDNIDEMSKKIEKFFDSEAFSNLRTMTCQNSFMTQKVKEGTRAEAFAKEIKSFGLGEDCCEICGEYKANSRSRLSRSYFPSKTAHTFYNYSNNLLGTNICSHCVALATFSLLNTRVASGNVVLYNSDSDEFMKEYTAHIQEENEDLIKIKSFSKSKDKKGKLTKFSLLGNLIDEKKMMELQNINYYIEICSFVNSSQTEKIEYENINSKNVKLLEKIYDNDFEKEFTSLRLDVDLLNNKLSTNYIYKIYDFKKEELKCSVELFDFLNKEVSRLSEDVVKIIERITDKVEFDKKLRNELKVIVTANDFSDFLVRLNEDYYDKHEEKLFTTEEYLRLTNKIRFREVRNTLLVSSLR